MAYLMKGNCNFPYPKMLLALGCCNCRLYSFGDRYNQNQNGNGLKVSLRNKLRCRFLLKFSSPNTPQDRRILQNYAAIKNSTKQNQTHPNMAEKLAPEKRHTFINGSQKVFEWDQTLEEVNIYISLPPNVPTKLFYCKIQSKHLEVGIKGNPPYLSHGLSCPVKTDSSLWTLEDGTMHVTLEKRDKGQTWSSPILGQGQLDAHSADLEQKRLMLQRFQEENPGFDFSQAQFSGNCPDPRTFMGGIKSD